MKLNLLMNSTDVRANYINIDPFPTLPEHQVFSEEKKQGDIRSLDWITDDGECEDILALDIINFLSPPEIERVTAGWCRKLKQGGSITLGTLDLREICRSMVHSNMPVPDAILALYGPQSQGWDIRKNALTLQILEQILQQNGCRITKKRSNNYKSIVTGQRG